jgi:hypothetical protein
LKRAKTRFSADMIQGSRLSEMPGFIKPQLATLKAKAKAPKGTSGRTKSLNIRSPIRTDNSSNG